MSNELSSGSQECLDDFVFGNLSGAEGLKLIYDVSESVKCVLDTDSLISLG